MADAGNSETKVGYILAIGPGYKKLSIEERAEAIAQLERIVEATTRFCVADVAGKVVKQKTNDGLVLIFSSDPEAPLECAVEIVRKLREIPENRFRAGIHRGAIACPTDSSDKSELRGEGIDLAQRIMGLGDGGHVLLSKQLAYELASKARWLNHLYDLGDCGIADQKISLVNFFTDEIGNSEVPTKLKRARSETARRAKFESLKRPALTVLLVLVLATALAAGYVLVRRALNIPMTSMSATIEKSVAVLLFADLSPARDQEYLSAGISEEILEAVAKLKGVRVIARDSAFALEGKNLDAGEIARRLNVQVFVRGSVRRDGNRIRVGVQVVSTADNSQLWARSFDGDGRQMPEIENEIARAVAESLKVNPAIAGRPQAWSDPLTNDLYLQGLFLSHKANEEDLKASLDFFRLALGKNPRLARAWSGSAKDWIQLSEQALVRPLDGFSSALKAASAALAIDPHDAEAHVCLGEAKRVLSWDLNGDEAELNRALDLDPNCVAALLSAALLKHWTGSPNESLANLQSAQRLDPFSPPVGHAEVIVDLDGDRFDAALAAAQRMMETDPNYTYFEPDLALVYREQGKLNEALDIYLRLEKTRPQSGLAITYARLSRQDEARKILAELIQRANDRYVPADEIAAIYVALDDREEAFRWLNRAADEHSATLHNLGSGRDFRSLRSDPRYPQLLDRIGLDPKRFVPR